MEFWKQITAVNPERGFYSEAEARAIAKQYVDNAYALKTAGQTDLEEVALAEAARWFKFAALISKSEAGQRHIYDLPLLDVQ
jgi:hypothetical protein